MASSQAPLWPPEQPGTALSSPIMNQGPQSSASALPTQSAQPSLTDPSAPPSPNELSAAVILATLADSRPPTSHGDYMDEEMDEDETGGISLEGMADELAYTYEPNIFSAPPVLAHIEQVMQPSGPSLLHEMLGQHAAALDSLNMEPLPVFPSSVFGLQEHVLPQNGLYDADSDPPPLSVSQDEYLSVTNKDAFLPITTFFRHFMSHKDTPISLDATTPPEVITREDLRGDECDIQGIDWSLRHTTRASVRAKRKAFETSRLQSPLLRFGQSPSSTPNTENYFAFRQMNTAHQAYIPHFQLRNLLATTSRNDIFYADRDLVLRTDASGTPASITMNLTKEMTESGKFQVTTLAAADDVLIAGGFEGEYALTGLSTSIETPAIIGRIHNRTRDSKSHITNHIHIFPARHTYSPQAVLCSNDNRLRILDVATNTFTHCFPHSQAVNCSATSPDGRMRVVVGDFRETLITNAETGQPFEALRTHSDDVFACDWADDGIHVATAAQDSTIVIWDARSWSRPLTVLRSELSIPRSLRFSPVGSGPRVLISAEADDYVNVINAQTFQSRQLFDFFGRTGGISLTPDGSSLFVANSDHNFGGILEFERCGWGEPRWGSGPDDLDGEEPVVDWLSEEDMRTDRRVVPSWHARERRGLDLGSWDL